MSAWRARTSVAVLWAAVASASEPRVLISREHDPGFLPNSRWGRTTYTLTINDEAKATLRVTLERPVDALRKKMTLPFWEAKRVDDTELVGSWTRQGKRLSVTLESLTLECRPRRVEVHAANAAVAYVNNCTPCYDAACAKPPRWTPAKSRTMEVMVCAIPGRARCRCPRRSHSPKGSVLSASLATRTARRRGSERSWRTETVRAAGFRVRGQRLS